MRASRNEKDASARIQELEDVSALKVPEARVESLRRALDEAEDKAGVRLRQERQKDETGKGQEQEQEQEQ